MGCGVPTGWGSAIYAANVQVGQTVAIYGVGGLGVNAVQGAVHAGARHIVAIDPLENKRAKAMELGATHAFADAGEALRPLASSSTNTEGVCRPRTEIAIGAGPARTGAGFRPATSPERCPKSGQSTISARP
ncbi:zinc-binding dehydrogenase [Nocardia xishanensis]